MKPGTRAGKTARELDTPMFGREALDRAVGADRVSRPGIADRWRQRHSEAIDIAVGRQERFETAAALELDTLPVERGGLVPLTRACRRVALGIAQEGDFREGGSLFGPGVELEPIPGLREVDEYHLPTVLVGKRRGCIGKIVHALPPRMVGGASTDTVAPALRRAFTRSRRSPPPDPAKHGTTAVGGVTSATPRCAGVPAARSGKQRGIRPDAQDGTETACLRTPVSPEQALERVPLRSKLPGIALPEPPRVHKLPAERRQGRGFRQSDRPEIRFGNVEREQERGNVARSAIQG